MCDCNKRQLKITLKTTQYEWRLGHDIFLMLLKMSFRNYDVTLNTYGLCFKIAIWAHMALDFRIFIYHIESFCLTILRFMFDHTPNSQCLFYHIFDICVAHVHVDPQLHST
jgi:hypothetical protein